MPATPSLHITVWTHRMLYREHEPKVPDEKIFDESVTDADLVHDAQEQLACLRRGVRGGHIMVETTYLYTFRFATGSETTEVYWGDIACPAWHVTTTDESEEKESVAGAMNAQLYGSNLLTTLHQRAGMPLPSWW